MTCKVPRRDGHARRRVFCLASQIFPPAGPLRSGRLYPETQLELIRADHLELNTPLSRIFSLPNSPPWHICSSLARNSYELFPSRSESDELPMFAILPFSSEVPPNYLVSESFRPGQSQGDFRLIQRLLKYEVFPLLLPSRWSCGEADPGRVLDGFDNMDYHR